MKPVSELVQFNRLRPKSAGSATLSAQRAKLYICAKSTFEIR